MRGSRVAFGSLVGALALALSCAGGPRGVAPPHAPSAERAPPALAFAIQEGRTDNRFFRDGPIAAHLLATSGDAPRVVVAFPAGNTGIGVWLAPAAELAITRAPRGVARADGMRGISAVLRARAASLEVRRALLASVRVLRDAGRDGPVPPGLDAMITAGPPVVLRRTTVDGAHHVELALGALDGASIDVTPGGGITLRAGPAGEIAFELTALTDEPPLTPIPRNELVTADAPDDARTRDALAFLSYEEKLLAGSWQYLTYFGRDTLLSTRLLMPVLQPGITEAALGAVIERMRADGDVAHEEDVGEWAAMENLARTPRPADLDEPIYDYKMVDDDFLLAPVLAAYALDDRAGAARAGAFFARRTRAGRSYADAVRANLARVVALAAPFAARPAPDTLVHLHDGLAVGDWRDSLEGLGGGRIPYDVNAALVPAALRAAARLYASDLLARDRAASERAAELARAWSSAGAMFRVTLDEAEARRRVAAYAAEQGIDATDALASISGPVSFPAVSLDAHGAPIPIENSDDGFVLLFGAPSPEELGAIARRVTDPFPAGLRTPVGIVVANPAYAADPALRALFTRDHYHGTVVWSWQQALLLAGLRRQLARADLPENTRRALADAERAVARVMDATKAMRDSELWSFAVDARGWHVVPFGQARGHHTEANAIQLWSTVSLALEARAPRSP